MARYRDHESSSAFVTGRVYVHCFLAVAKFLFKISRALVPPASVMRRVHVFGQRRNDDALANRFGYRNLFAVQRVICGAKSFEDASAGAALCQPPILRDVVRFD